MTGINRQPRGLSDLVQVQSGGKNPDDLSPIVRPTIDIAPYYEADRITAALEPFSLAVGQAEFIQIPDNEVWKIISMSCEVDTLVTSGNDVYFNFGVERIQPLGLNAIWLFGDGLTVFGTSAANQSVVGGFLPQPLILGSGMRPVLQLGWMSGPSPATGDFSILYVRMDT